MNTTASTTSIPGPTIGNVDYPRGWGGLHRGLLELAHRIKAAARDHQVIAEASQILHAANLPIPRGRIDPTRTVRALFAAQKGRITFVRDPVNTERMASTAQLWCLPGELCVPAGDCDDQIIALGGMTLAVGIPVRVVTRLYAGQAQTHTTMQYESSPKYEGKWVGIDPSTESGSVSTKPYLKEWIIEVDMGSETEPGVFVGMGDVPDVIEAEGFTVGGVGTMGAGESPPATPPFTGPLPDPMAQVWVTELQQTGNAFAQTATLLQTNATAYAQFRQANGLAQYDPDPTGADLATMQAAPLAYYATNKVWTQAAAQQEAKLIQTNQFIAGVIVDALTGKRALYWDDGRSDLGIASAPGDPYYVLMQPNAAGVMTPTFVDPATAAPTGTMGVLPVIAVLAIAAGVVALSIAAIYAVEKITAYVAQAHHDDMVSKTSTAAAELVSSGKMTPDQAMEFLKNSQGLAASGIIPQPPPPAGDGFSWITMIGVGVGGALLGALVSAFFAPRLAPHVERTRRAVSSGIDTYRSAA
jgi:hypothetical protein